MALLYLTDGRASVCGLIVAVRQLSIVSTVNLKSFFTVVVGVLSSSVA